MASLARVAQHVPVIPIKGERWRLHDGSEIIITWKLANGFIRVLNESGQLEVIEKSHLKEKLS